MFAVTRILEQLEEFQTLRAAVDGGTCPVAASGLSAVHRAHVAACLHLSTGRPILMVCPDEADAAHTADDLLALTGGPVLSLPAREFVFHNAATVSREWEHRRIEALYRMGRGEAKLIVTTPDALLCRTVPPDILTAGTRELEQDGTYPLEPLCDGLAAAGYTRCDRVEGPGQFSLRGGILDVFSPGMRRPVRAEFFGDQIDAMGEFDPQSQRRTENIRRALLLPAAEALPAFSPGGRSGLCAAIAALREKVARRKGDHTALLATLDADLDRIREGISFPALDRYVPLLYPDFLTAADYLPPDAVVCFSESARTAERAKGFLRQAALDVQNLLESGYLAGELSAFWPDWDGFTAALAARPLVYLDAFPGSSYPCRPRRLTAFSCKQLPLCGASPEATAEELSIYARGGFGAVLCCASEARAQILFELLSERKLKATLDLSLKKLPAPGRITLTLGGLSGGMEYPAARFALLAEGTAAPPRRPASGRKSSPRQKMLDYTDLSPGDLVVHVHHGIGRFVELVQMQVDGITRDYVKLAYAGGDTLYQPATQLDLISKYIGGGGEESAGPRLSKLGGTEWARTKTRARAAAKDLADGLIRLYAERQRLEGHAFPPDVPWQVEFEAAFEYQETEDQLHCAEEIKRDMERTVPMDRLLCGDVGYGKTEVALRAAMKCMLDGKQAAILVPTTVLAQQHYLTAAHRFARYPIHIDVLSRFRTPAQHRQTLRRVAEGQVDLLIGTHRLLQKDIRFHDLGLLIVDEEQRFGVTHKERLKEMARQVDVLTLTATPIPRTLNMALSGIRDMSTIEEPPQNRQPVQTYVLEHDRSVLADAIDRELRRGGQVYYLYNRIDTIDRAAARLAEQFPDAVVGVAHGRMGEEALSSAMQRMVDGEMQILVCTTIIETGIDIPNVNTLIIEDADHLGLAQLHQIRGRVGRSPRRAYAYMTYRQGKILTETAAKRLAAIRDFAAFGSGFQIAMRDLEIRGAGNLLGPEQSGHMMTVGYDMYLKLLEEAVLEAKGETARRPAECAVELSIAASIPASYIESGEQRMDFYRRIARVRTRESAEDLCDELRDRYGEPPQSVHNLLSVSLLRAAAAEAGVSELAQKEGHLNLAVSLEALPRVAFLCGGRYRGRLFFSAGEHPYLSLRIRKDEDVLALAEQLVADYAAAGDPPPKPDAADGSHSKEAHS